MRKKHFSEEQIVTAPQQVDRGDTAAEVSRTMGISQQTLYSWKNKYGEMESNDLIRLNTNSTSPAPCD